MIHSIAILNGLAPQKNFQSAKLSGCTTSVVTSHLLVAVPLHIINIVVPCVQEELQQKLTGIGLLACSRQAKTVTDGALRHVVYTAP